MNKARIILTKKCRRNCAYCCNNYTPHLAEAIELTSLEQLKSYDTIMLTGGEPMDFPNMTFEFARQLRQDGFHGKLFLYTARYHARLRSMLAICDGIQYTLHSNASCNDASGFHLFQDLLVGVGRTKSCRLFVHEDVSQFVSIRPELWSSIKIGPWLNEDDCPLPSELGEQLFFVDNPPGLT